MCYKSPIRQTYMSNKWTKQKSMGQIQQWAEREKERETLPFTRCDVQMISHLRYSFLREIKNV